MNTQLKILSILLIFLYTENSVFSQEPDTGITGQAKVSSLWNNLVPKHLKIQYAGSMGFLSGGIGWSHGKNKRWETDLMIGYIPKKHGSKNHLTLTLKENYIPFKINLSSKTSFEPLETGIYFSRIFGDEFWQRLPDKYPNDYYVLATNLRFNIFLGQRIRFLINEEKKNYINLFYEFSTNDLYIIDMATNKCIDLWDIISLSIGFKYQF